MAQKWLIFDLKNDSIYLNSIQRWINISKNDFHTYKEKIKENEDYSEAIKFLLEDRLLRAEIAIILITQNTLNNPWTHWEIHTIIQKNIYTVGILLQENHELLSILNQYENKKIISFDEIAIKMEINEFLNP